MKEGLFAEVISWDVPSSGARWTDVIDALGAVGLSKNHAPPLTARQTFSRAMRDFKEGRTIDRVKTAGSTVWQMTKMEYEGDKILYDPEVTFYLGVNGRLVDCPDNPELGGLVEGLMAKAQEVRTGQDISKIIARIYDEHTSMFPVVPRKGVVYVVPVEYEELNSKVEQFLAKVGGNLHRFPVPEGDEKGKKSVRDAIDAGLAGMVAEIEAATNDWDEKTRQGTFKRAFENLDLVNLKVEHYASYLEDRKADLEAALAEAKARISARIKSLAAEGGDSEEEDSDSRGGDRDPSKRDPQDDGADGEAGDAGGHSAGRAPIDWGAAANAPAV